MDKENKDKPVRSGKGKAPPDNDQVISNVKQHLMTALSLLKTESLRRSARDDLSCLALLKEAGRLGGLKEFDSKSAFIGANIVRQDASFLCGAEAPNNSTQIPKQVKPAKGKAEPTSKPEKQPKEVVQASKKLRLPCGADVLERQQQTLFRAIIEEKGESYFSPLYNLKRAYSVSEATVNVGGQQKVWQAVDFCFLKKRTVYDEFEDFLISEGLTFEGESLTVSKVDLTNTQIFFWSSSDSNRGIVKFRPLVSQRALLVEEEKGEKSRAPRMTMFPVMVKSDDTTWTVFNTVQKTEE